MDLRAKLQTIADMADSLKEAGLEWVKVDGVEFRLTPKTPKDPDKNEWQQASLKRASGSALDDPATFGGRSMPVMRGLMKDWGIDS